jgi:hypothetical protein
MKACADPLKLNIPGMQGGELGPNALQAQDGSVPHGATVGGFSCHAGGEYQGSTQYTCNNGQWWDEGAGPSCSKGCSNFPALSGQGHFVYADGAVSSHREGSTISELKCAQGSTAVGFAPLTCHGGRWEGESLGSCAVDSSVSVSLQGPVTGEASFYIYLFLGRERVAGYLIDKGLYSSFKDKRYAVPIMGEKAYSLRVECGDFRAPDSSKGVSYHHKFVATKEVTFTPGEQLQVSCGSINSDRQAEILLEETPLAKKQ